MKAAATIIETLISGTAIASPECRLDIVELNLLAVPDWIEAAWHLKYSWESDSGKPRIAYFGFARDLAVQKASLWAHGGDLDAGVVGGSS